MADVAAARSCVNSSFSDGPAGAPVQGCLAEQRPPLGKVISAYFAKKVETAKSFIEQPYQVVQGDTYNKVAAKFPTVDADNLKSYRPLQPGTTILLKLKKKTKELSFTRINQARIGEKVCILIESSGLRTGTVQTEVLGSNNTTFVAPDASVKLLQGAAEKDVFKADVGAWAKNPEYINAAAFTDFAILEVELRPKKEADRKLWATKTGESPEKKAFLHLKVTATGAPEIEYTCEEDGAATPSRERGIFLNRSGHWFELCACYCSMKMDAALFKRLFSIKDDFVFGHRIMEKYRDSTYQTPIDTFLAALENCFTTYEVNNCNRRAHMLGQIWLETDVFKALEEYADGKAYEPDARDDARANGNTEVGDGPKYKGRGCMQLTWKKAYKAYQKYINETHAPYLHEDLVANYAKVASDLFLAIDSAGWFWKHGKLKSDGSAISFNTLADQKKVDVISTYVNGGGNGKAERREITKTLLSEFNADLCPNIPAT